MSFYREDTSSKSLSKQGLHQINENSRLSFIETRFENMAENMEAYQLIVFIRLYKQGSPLTRRGVRVVRWCWVNFQCRGVLQFGLQ